MGGEKYEKNRSLLIKMLSSEQNVKKQQPRNFVSVQ